MKIKTKDLIDFKGYSERKKSNFAGKLLQENLEAEQTELTESGGDYWVRCISAINAACHDNDNSHILNKINDIQNDKNKTTHKGTLQKYDRNLTILHNFENYNFLDILPDNFAILNKTLKQGEITIGKFELKSKIHQLFTFTENGTEKIGAILFVARKDKNNKSELGIFTELMFRLLVSNYADKYVISSENILAIDLMSTDIVNYAMIESSRIPSQLNNTLNEIQDLLREG